MEKKNLKPKVIEDERTEFVTNKYAANAFIFLAYYIFISVLIKSFILDVNIFVYWDNAIAMAIGGVYMIYRSADEGAPVAPAAVKIFNPAYIRVFAVVSALFGLFVTFVASGMDERLMALMPGVTEKLAGAVIIGSVFFLMIIVTVWLIDVLPTKLAFIKAAELTGESGDEMPDQLEIIKQGTVNDERIDSTAQKYAAHAFYFLCVYIFAGTMFKIFITDINLIYYYDAFLAAIAACGYFSFKIVRAGIYEEQPFTKKEKRTGWLTAAAAYLGFGWFVAFIVFPMEENLASRLDSFSSKLSLAILMAVLFGVGMYLIGKGVDWYAKKRADELIESD